MFAWLKSLWRPAQREFVCQIFAANGTPLMRHYVWAADALKAREEVMSFYDPGVFLIGPAEEVLRHSRQPNGNGVPP